MAAVALRARIRRGLNYFPFFYGGGGKGYTLHASMRVQATGRVKQGKKKNTARSIHHT
jgi:hypothetical protein